MTRQWQAVEKPQQCFGKVGFNININITCGTWDPVAWKPVSSATYWMLTCNTKPSLSKTYLILFGTTRLLCFKLRSHNNAIDIHKLVISATMKPQKFTSSPSGVTKL